MKIQSKCWNCAEWTENSGELEDRCVFCNEVINKTRFENANKIHSKKLADKNNSILIIRDEDGFLLRLLKKSGLIVQFIFVSFASFILWIVALLAG